MARRYKGVDGGTPSGEPLCRTCRYAHYIKGQSVSSERLYCRELGGAFGLDFELREEMFECSRYSDKRRAKLDSMAEIAWILHSDTRKGGKVGFTSAREWRKRNPDEELVPIGALTKKLPR